MYLSKNVPGTVIRLGGGAHARGETRVRVAAGRSRLPTCYDKRAKSSGTSTCGDQYMDAISILCRFTFLYNFERRNSHIHTLRTTKRDWPRLYGRLDATGCIVLYKICVFMSVRSMVYIRSANFVFCTNFGMRLSHLGVL